MSSFSFLTVMQYITMFPHNRHINAWEYHKMASYDNRKVGRMKLEQPYGQLHVPCFKL